MNYKKSSGRWYKYRWPVLGVMLFVVVIVPLTVFGLLIYDSTKTPPESQANAILFGYEGAQLELRLKIITCDPDTTARAAELKSDLQTRTAALEAREGSDVVAKIKTRRQEFDEWLDKTLRSADCNWNSLKESPSGTGP